MKSFRVLVAVVALLALPLIAVHAQSRGRGKGPRASSEVCASPAGQSGKVPPGQAKRCPPPPVDSTPPDSTPPDSTPPDTTPPQPTPPPSGVNFASGTVFADLDADGVYSPFAGDTVLAGVALQLMWQGAVVASGATDANGLYRFDGLGSTDSASWAVCVSVPSGVTQGPPPPGMSYNGCGGTGYSFAFPVSNPFQQAFMGNFSMLVP
jgi:hypothetical protein